MKNIRSLVENSMLWAAYGDALGFITELAEEESGVKWRSGQNKIQTTISWRRKLGGLFGVTAKFPAGTYSDDTQLRLATIRAINSNGMFDVEAFAKIELPLWNCYALGAGRGTKDAAFNLTKKNVRWNSNFYKGAKGGRSYIDSGGNGAAMRIQPHVWAGMGQNSFSEIARDVVRNTITTHGHPHGIIGAVFHALCLYKILDQGYIPEPTLWANLAIDAGKYTLQAILNDSDLSTVWLSQWNNNSTKSFEEVHNSTALEIHSMADSIGIYTDKHKSYEKLVEEFDANNPEIRGMASLTSIFSLAVAFIYNSGNKNVLTEVVNCLGTDTDTIATMAGALIGALPNEKQPSALQDHLLLIEEANKLTNISEGRETRKFQYPSLLTWQPPTKASDVVRKIEDIFLLPGLGEINIGEKIGESNDTSWFWATLSFGQSIIIKISSPIPELKNSESFPFKPYMSQMKSRELYKENQPQLPLMERDSTLTIKNIKFEKLDANRAFDLAKKSNFEAEAIGNLLIELTKLDTYTLETVSAFSVLVSKAIIERTKKRYRLEGQ